MAIDPCVAKWLSGKYFEQGQSYIKTLTERRETIPNCRTDKYLLIFFYSGLELCLTNIEDYASNIVGAKYWRKAKTYKNFPFFGPPSVKSKELEL